MVTSRDGTRSDIFLTVWRGCVWRALSPRKFRGFYVETGAFHPFRFSNTYYFYRWGWSGILVEPNPIGFRRLKKYRKRDTCLNIAISDTTNTVDFTADGAFSGIADESHLFRNRNPKAQRIRVQCQPLVNIFDEHVPPNQAIHFMSIDCLGHDEIVLDSNNWNKYAPYFLLVESHSDGRGDMSLKTKMDDLGYIQFAKLHLTIVFLRKDLSDRV